MASSNSHMGNCNMHSHRAGGRRLVSVMGEETGESERGD